VFDHFFTTKDVGKGTTFIIRLPIEPESSAAAEETPQHEEAYSLRG